jgi:hypothetical protein
MGNNKDVEVEEDIRLSQWNIEFGLGHRACLGARRNK